MSNDEILGFAKLFNDELTLDNISRLVYHLSKMMSAMQLLFNNNPYFICCRPRLVNMCKYMGISPYGTDAYLRYMLRKRLQWYVLLMINLETWL